MNRMILIILFAISAFTNSYAEEFTMESLAEDLEGINGEVVKPLPILKNKTYGYSEAGAMKMGLTYMIKGYAKMSRPLFGQTHCWIETKKLDGELLPDSFNVISADRWINEINDDEGVILYTDGGFNISCLAGPLVWSMKLGHSGLKLKNIAYHLGNYLQFTLD